MRADKYRSIVFVIDNVPVQSDSETLGLVEMSQDLKLKIISQLQLTA